MWGLKVSCFALTLSAAAVSPPSIWARPPSTDLPAESWRVKAALCSAMPRIAWPGPRASSGTSEAVAAGAQIGRVSLNGAYGNYFENRGDLGINLDRAGHYVLTAGWSSALGWNGGVKLNLARKK